jgi:flagellar hook-associated protein 1 FlgK
MVTVSLADGQALVSGDQIHEFEIIVNAANGLSDIYLNGQPAAINDGKLRGLQDAIGDIGTQITSIDDLAAAVANRVNTLHTSGTDFNGNPGTDFFTIPVGGVDASNLSVTALIQADPKLIVASQLASPITTATVAGQIGALLSEPTSTAGTKTGSFSSIYASIVSDAGRGVKSAEDALAVQKAVLSQAEAQRDAISGVSLDEEAINLLQFQRSYEAAARFLKIADEMTQTIMSLGT